MNFPVASYNIHKCAGLDRRVDLDRIADVIREIDAALVGLQEVFRPEALSLAARVGVRAALGPPALLHLFKLDFGLQSRERAEQVRRLVREHILHDELTGPRVVVGDLNEWFWFRGPVGRTLRRELHGPRIRRTHPAPLPLFPLDRIYWDRDLAADGFHVHRSRLARVASDHLPVVARLRMASARG